MTTGWHVAINSWGGQSRHPVEVLKVCPKRVRVRWLDGSAGRRKDEISYAPKYSLCRRDGDGGKWIGWED